MTTSDVGLVNFNRPCHRLRVHFFHGRANSVAKKPSRLVADSQSAAELIRAHPLLGFAEQVGAEKPLPQGKVRVIKDGSGGHRELVAASIAVVLVALENLRNLGRQAARAGHLIWPAESFKVGTAAIFALESFNQRYQIYGVHHG